jgi:hypothetical protein
MIRIASVVIGTAIALGFALIPIYVLVASKPPGT